MQNTPRSNRTTHSGQSVSTQSNTKAKIRAAAMEALEQRQLLASGSWQPLVITCTAQDDVVLFKQQGDFLTVTNGLNLSGNSIVFTPQTVSGVGSSGTSGWLVSAAAAVPEPSSLIPVAATLFLLTLIYQRRTRITKYKV